jgi:DNA-directed RNA polymerase subunit RPC12/RpoP
MGAVKYRCPDCGFRIFNRRVPKCESCGAKLPAELLLSPEGIAVLDAAHEKSKKERAARARAEKGADDTAELGTFDFGDGGGGD